jgi:SAM-dependent methyltransferase
LFRFLSDNPESVRRWFEQPGAANLRAQESRLIGQLMSGLSGYRCVALTGWPLSESVLDRAGTLRRWQLGVSTDDRPDICWDGRHLPLATGSVDALVLLHGLEMTGEPHALVRECARVLSDRGQIVVCCFNPLSWWATCQSLSWRHGARFSPLSTPPRAARLADWLRVLDIETLECWRHGSGFPLFGRPWQDGADRPWLAALAWSAPGYVLVARRAARCRPQSGHRQPRLTKQSRPGLAQASRRGYHARDEK